MHGRDHRPGGMDPIPGLTSGLPIAASAIRSGRSIAGDNSPHYLSMQDGVSTGQFSTTDGTIFANDSHTYFGTPIYGIGIHAVGTYRCEFNAFVTAGTGGVKAIVYWTATTGVLSYYQEGRTGLLQVDAWDDGISQQHISWTEYIVVRDSGDIPFHAAMYAQVVSGSSVFVTPQMFITQINPAALTAI